MATPTPEELEKLIKSLDTANDSLDEYAQKLKDAHQAIVTGKLNK